MRGCRLGPGASASPTHRISRGPQSHSKRRTPDASPPIRVTAVNANQFDHRRRPRPRSLTTSFCVIWARNIPAELIPRRMRTMLALFDLARNYILCQAASASNCRRGSWRWSGCCLLCAMGIGPDVVDLRPTFPSPRRPPRWWPVGALAPSALHRVGSRLTPSW